MIAGKNGKKYEENKFAKMLALVGGAMKYLDKHGDLKEYDQYYIENCEKDGFHYKMQRYGDKIVRRNLKKKGVHCRKSKAKRFYRYNTKTNSRVVEETLYDYFAYVMDYIFSNEKLLKITVNNILGSCRCDLDSEYDICLNKILERPYKQLVDILTYFTITDERKKKRAKITLLL